MFEVRWHERATGKSMMNEFGYYFDETTRVLQYRYKYNQAVYSYAPNLLPSNDTFISVWSEWIDVPVISEKEMKNA